MNKNPYHKSHLKGDENGIHDVAARGRTVVSGSFGTYVRVWDIITGECKWIFSGHTDKSLFLLSPFNSTAVLTPQPHLVTSVALDPTRNIACSSSKDKTVRVWDLNTGTARFTLTGHIDVVIQLALSGSHLVSASEDGTLRVWDPDTGEMKRKLRTKCTCFQRSESKVLAGGRRTIKIRDLTDGSVVRDISSGDWSITFVKATFDDRWCVAVTKRSDGSFIDTWDFGTEVTENVDGTRELRDVSGQTGESSNGFSDDTTEDEYEE